MTELCQGGDVQLDHVAVIDPIELAKASPSSVSGVVDQEINRECESRARDRIMEASCGSGSTQVLRKHVGAHTGFPDLDRDVIECLGGASGQDHVCTSASERMGQS